MQCQQISSKASASTVIKAKRTVSVAATKKWQQTAAAAALSAGLVVSAALPAFAESEEELMARVKVRVCVENPTAQLCIPKRTQVFQFLQNEVDEKNKSD